MDLVQQLAQPSEQVLERLRVDTRYVWAGAAEGFDGSTVDTTRDGARWTDFTDEFGVTWSMPHEAPRYYDISHSPLAGLSVDEIRQ